MLAGYFFLKRIFAADSRRAMDWGEKKRRERNRSYILSSHDIVYPPQVSSKGEAMTESQPLNRSDELSETQLLKLQ